MKVKTKLLQAFMEKHKMTAAGLAQEIEISVSEVEKLLNGEAVDERTARKFIYYFGAGEAQRLVDWKAINKVNPFACEADKDDDEVEV
jgi:plasmid maintenance system antidote protein VapI